MTEHPIHDLQTLVTALAHARLGSRVLLRMSLEALATDGVAGQLRIHIPRKTSDPIEVEFFGLNPHPDSRITP